MILYLYMMSLRHPQEENQDYPEDTAPSDDMRVVGLDNDVADIVFTALTAATTRTILSLLYDQPLIPTDIQETIGTSRQNVQYHLAKLEEAGLIEPAGVEQSEKGTDMTKYAPAKEAVVLVAGRESDQLRIRETLS